MMQTFWYKQQDINISRVISYIRHIKLKEVHKNIICQSCTNQNHPKFLPRLSKKCWIFTNISRDTSFWSLRKFSWLIMLPPDLPSTSPSHLMTIVIQSIEQQYNVNQHNQKGQMMLNKTTNKKQGFMKPILFQRVSMI